MWIDGWQWVEDVRLPVNRERSFMCIRVRALDAMWVMCGPTLKQ